MQDVENESFTLRQGAAGTLVAQLKTGDISRAAKKIGQEGLVEVANLIADDARGEARRHRDNTPAGERRRRGVPRQHLDEEIRSGPTKIGSAFIRGAFPMAFVELGHDIVKGRGRRGRDKRGRFTKGSRKRKGEVVGHADPVPIMRPAFKAGLRRVKAAVERRRLR